MWELKAKCDQLQKDFLRLIERDAEVFEPLSKAYGMPRETEEEKAEKARNQEQESWKTNRKNFIYLQLHVNNIKWNKILIVYIL